MTREELRERIRDEIGRQGYAVVPSGDVWGAFAAPGEDTSVSFDDALNAFAAFNGWVVRRNDPALAGVFAFYRAGQAPLPVESPRGL